MRFKMHRRQSEQQHVRAAQDLDRATVGKGRRPSLLGDGGDGAPDLLPEEAAAAAEEAESAAERAVASADRVAHELLQEV